MRLVTKGLNRNERLIIISRYYYEELTMKEIGSTRSVRITRQPDAFEHSQSTQRSTRPSTS
ncbi:MAG: sigma factor-like helix-turn-helix DNA-binding protein [Planctomycetaceae bacterium]